MDSEARRLPERLTTARSFRPACRTSERMTRATSRLFQLTLNSDAHMVTTHLQMFTDQRVSLSTKLMKSTNRPWRGVVRLPGVLRDNKKPSEVQHRLRRLLRNNTNHGQIVAVVLFGPSKALLRLTLGISVSSSSQRILKICAGATTFHANTLCQQGMTSHPLAYVPHTRGKYKLSKASLASPLSCRGTTRRWLRIIGASTLP